MTEIHSGNNIASTDPINSSSSHTFQKHVLHSFAWLAGLKYCGQVITWFITIFVIRLLEPRDYGVMAQAYVFAGFLSLISELGFGTVIVQRKELTQPLLRTAFSFILLSNGIMFVFSFFCAPIVARFYAEPLLTPIIRVLSYAYLIMAFYALPQSLLYRNMNFRLKGSFDLTASVASAASTLTLAYLGFGIWSLVWGNLVFHITLLLCYLYKGKLLYRLRFSLKDARDLITMGGYISGGRIIWYFYSQADIIIGGKFLTSQVVGVYSIALKLGNMPLEKFIPLVNQVAVPTYAKVQDSLQTVRNCFLKSIRLVSFFMFLLYFGLFSTASDLVIVLLDKKWEHAIVPLQLLAFIMPWRAIGSLYAPLLVGIGRADIHFLNVVVSFLILPIAFIIGVRVDDIRGLCFAWISGYSIVFLMMTIISSRQVKVRFLDIIISIYPAFLSSLAMASALFWVRSKFLPSIAPLSALLVCSVIGVALYTGIFSVLNKQGIVEIYKTFYKLLHKSPD